MLSGQGNAPTRGTETEYGRGSRLTKLGHIRTGGSNPRPVGDDDVRSRRTLCLGFETTQKPIILRCGRPRKRPALRPRWKAMAEDSKASGRGDLASRGRSRMGGNLGCRPISTTASLRHSRLYYGKDESYGLNAQYRVSPARPPKDLKKTVDPEPLWLYIHECHPRGLIAQSGWIAPFCHSPASISWSFGSSL
jgi:hypothetical protein